jgi:hypothetical protein
VHETVGQSIARARGLPREERPMTQQDVVPDMLKRISLPESLKQDLRKRHGLD